MKVIGGVNRFLEEYTIHRKVTFHMVAQSFFTRVFKDLLFSGPIAEKNIR